MRRYSAIVLGLLWTSWACAADEAAATAGRPASGIDPSDTVRTASRPSVSAAGTSWSQAIRGLRGRVVLARKKVINGTAIVDARLELENTTNAPIKLSWSREGMKFQVADSEGRDVPPARSIPYDGRVRTKEDVVIPPRQRTVLRMSASGMGIRGDMAGLIDLGASNCWEFKSADKEYYLKAVLEVSRDSAPDAGKGRSWHGRMEFPPAPVPLKPRPLDPARAGELIRQLGARMVEAPHSGASGEAADALSLIDDRRVIPWYVKAVETDSSQLRLRALDRLSRFKDDAALEGIRKGMGTQGSDIGNCSTPQVARQAAEGVRLAAAYALARSEHPKAKGLLLTMRGDRYRGVRIVVVQTFGKMDTKRALDLLEEMSRDGDEGVRGEAKRYLELRKK